MLDSDEVAKAMQQHEWAGPRDQAVARLKEWSRKHPQAIQNTEEMVKLYLVLHDMVGQYSIEHGGTFRVTAALMMQNKLPL